MGASEGEDVLEAVACGPCSLEIDASLRDPLGVCLPSAAGSLTQATAEAPSMLTAAEIADVSLFAAFGAAERERLARAAADISLLPGEHAAYEGSERALFAVLAGRIEAVKHSRSASPPGPPWQGPCSG